MRSLALVFVVMLAVTAPAAAQWRAGGVAFPITPFDDWSCFLPDGAGGVQQLFPPIYGIRDVHSQHLFADGTPDPLDGASGVVVAPARWGVGNLAAVTDGGGGVVTVFLRCGPPLAHTRCWENGDVALLRSHGGVAAPGWPDTGIVIGPATFYTVPPLASDGAGGAILLLGDAVQRWTGAGVAAWAPEPGHAGVRWATSTSGKLHVNLAADGAGGAWVAWDEAFANDPVLKVVRLAHVSAAGARTTDADGVSMTSGPQLRTCGLVPDGAGGVFVAWTEPGSPFEPVRVQHAGADGAPWWPEPGAQAGVFSTGANVTLTACGEDDVALVVRDAGGIWRVQKLSGGAPAWPDAPEGRAVGAAGFAPLALTLLADGSGGLFALWSDTRTGSADPWATLLEADGTPAPGWTLAGVALANRADGEFPAALVAGAAPGEAIACWSRPSALYPGLYDLVAQKLVTGGMLDVAPTAPALALAAPWPNPTRDAWLVSFRLPAPGEARLEVFDVAGRRVAQARVRAAGAGPQQARLDASSLAPGVYRVRLRAAAGECSRAALRVR